MSSEDAMIVIDEAKNMELVIAAVQSAMSGEDVVIVVNGMAVNLVPVESQADSSHEEDMADISYAESVLSDPSRFVPWDEAKKRLGFSE